YANLSFDALLPGSSAGCSVMIRAVDAVGEMKTAMAVHGPGQARSTLPTILPVSESHQRSRGKGRSGPSTCKPSATRSCRLSALNCNGLQKERKSRFHRGPVSQSQQVSAEAKPSTTANTSQRFRIGYLQVELTGCGSCNGRAVQAD